MRTIIGVTLVTLFISVSVATAQQENGSKTDQKKENLEKDSKILDKEVATFSAKIEDVVKMYDLMNAEEIQILPYRTSYDKGDGYIEMTRHTFIRRDSTGEIIGIKTKSLKIYSGGETISKLESTIFERNYARQSVEEVKIIDPSPTSEDTSDITFTQKVDGKVVINEKSLKDIRNTPAFPIANDIKRDFYVPHLTFFYYSIRTIGETYNKNSKDTDTVMTDFLTESVDY